MPMFDSFRAQQFDPGQSDKCTWWFDGDWESCCLVHDAAYHYGGTARQRKQADQWLRDCVIDQGGIGHWFMGWIMYFGVRVFAHPAWPTPMLPVKHQPWNGHRPYKQRLSGYYRRLQEE